MDRSIPRQADNKSHQNHSKTRSRSATMNATELINHMNRTPFQPLEIHLNDGSMITVREPFEIATQRKSPRFVMYAADRMAVIAYRDVAKITTLVTDE